MRRTDYDFLIYLLGDHDVEPGQVNLFEVVIQKIEKDIYRKHETQNQKDGGQVPACLDVHQNGAQKVHPVKDIKELFYEVIANLVKHTDFINFPCGFDRKTNRFQHNYFLCPFQNSTPFLLKKSEKIIYIITTNNSCGKAKQCRKIIYKRDMSSRVAITNRIVPTVGKHI